MRRGAGRLVQKARSVMAMTHHVLLSPSLPHSSVLPFLRASVAAATMSGSSVIVPGSVVQQKRALRSEIRKALKALPPAQRVQEGLLLLPLSSLLFDFFKLESLAGYVRKKSRAWILFCGLLVPSRVQLFICLIYLFL